MFVFLSFLTGFTRSRDEFLARISDPKRCFTPYGEHIGSYPQEGNKNVTFEIYKVTIFKWAGEM